MNWLGVHRRRLAGDRRACDLAARAKRNDSCSRVESARPQSELGEEPWRKSGVQQHPLETKRRGEVFSILGLPFCSLVIWSLLLLHVTAEPLLSILPIANQEFNENTVVGPLRIVVAISGAPAENLAASATSSNPSLVPSTNLVMAGAGTDWTLQILPASGIYGSTTITVTVRDASGGSASTSFIVTVKHVNHPPVFASEPPIVAKLGQLYSYTVVVTDSDSQDTLEVTASLLPPWLSFNPVTRVLSGVPTRGNPEQDAVALAVQDQWGAVTRQVFPIWVEDNITLTNTMDVETRRQELVAYIWGQDGWPTNRELSLLLTNCPAKEYNALRNPDGNLARVDLYACPLLVEAGLNSCIYHFLPIRSNGRLFIVHTGHFSGGFWEQDVDLNNGGVPPGLMIPALLEEGYSVLAIDMPLFTAGLGFPQHARLQDGQEVDLYNHDDMFRFFDRPMRYFIEPVITALNTVQAKYNYRRIYMTGLSGGGWTATVCPAVDPRIERSFPVAGSVPNYLRIGYEGVGDYEQDDPGLFGIVNYEELYVMDAFGTNRCHLQILNLYDSCCFWGTRYTNWVDSVTAAVDGLGSGSYRFW